MLRDILGDFAVLVIGMVLGMLIGGRIVFEFVFDAHERGVRDGISGRYVIVQQPDGTSVVVENKEAGK
jgi:hypothetical protein